MVSQAPPSQSSGYLLNWTTDAKVLQLVNHYGMENPDPKLKVPNLNWFLRAIGVTYQYVYPRPFRPFPQ